MSPHLQVQQFNSIVEVGDLVVLIRDDGSEFETRTRAMAQVLSDRTAAIWLDSGLGAHPLERVKPMFPKVVRR